ncbi:hypothetical protein JCM8547_005634 [Rhodosporidiobolus lusitaniae]
MAPDASHPSTARPASPATPDTLKHAVKDKVDKVEGGATGGTRQSADAGSFGFDSDAELLALTRPPKFEADEEGKEKERAYLKERLAGALRIFAREGLDHHVAGHLTVRDPGDPTTFWVNPFGLSFACMTVSDLILVSHDGKVIGGGKPGRRVVNRAGFLIHSAIHKARPDVNAICHSHSLYGKTWSTLGIPLPFTTQDSCSFYKSLALLPSFGGVVLSSREGDRIAQALGAGRAIVLQNHGILTAGSSIDSAVASYILLETQCKVQLLALSASAGLNSLPSAHPCAPERSVYPIEIDEEEVKFTAGTGGEELGYFVASPYFQRIEKEEGHEYRQ